MLFVTTELHLQTYNEDTINELLLRIDFKKDRFCTYMLTEAELMRILKQVERADRLTTCFCVNFTPETSSIS